MRGFNADFQSEISNGHGVVMEKLTADLRGWTRI
jgi:hypothetical protein